MGIDALGYTLALLTIGMSFIAVRYRNMLLTLGASVLWVALLTFILANTTAGANWQSIFISGAVAFISAFALISFFSRSRGGGSFTQNLGGLTSRENKEQETPRTPRGLMDLNNAEYRAYIRARMNRRARR